MARRKWSSSAPSAVAHGPQGVTYTQGAQICNVPQEQRSLYTSGFSAMSFFCNTLNPLIVTHRGLTFRSPPSPWHYGILHNEVPREPLPD